MNLRLANQKDSKTLYDWRNEESVRRQSINIDPIPWSVHMKWFKKSLSNPNRQIYFAEVDGEDVGVIRADKDENGYELSWIVDSRFRGKGYGRQMLSQIIESLHGCLYASIKTDNVPSLAMVQSLGFRCVSPKDTTFSKWVLEK